MAANCNEPYYVKSYKRFLANFANTENANDPLPVSLGSFNSMNEREITGEIIDVTLKYLNDLQCPTHLQAHIVHQVLQEVKHTRKKQPENYGLKHQDGQYRLQLVDAIKSTVNKVCTHYLDDNKIVSLPPPPSTPFPEVVAEGYRNYRKCMEDRHAVIHDLNTIFNIRDDSVANYYAVFDGHAGEDAAVYCATHLHQYLVESVHYPTNPERALRDAFLTTDEKFTEKCMANQKRQSGTTAVSVLIYRKKLYCAWVGDSSAIIVRRGAVTEIVNPHRPSREDEKERIEKMGGGVWHVMGTKRVNGILSVSRAIGDASYKPFISAEPEVRTIPLDGTEDFVLIGTDGFWDHVESSDLIASCVYQEICQQPYSLKRVHKTILDRARVGGSEDNITAILVLLTPASEIAARITTTTTTTTSPIGYQTIGYKQCGADKEHGNKMDLTNSLLSSNENGQHEPTNGSAFLKHLQLQQQQQHQQQLLPRGEEEEEEEEVDGEQQENGAGVNDNHRIMYQGSSNGKHENGDADYDYSDLGPETDVDAIDEMLPSASPVKNLNYDMYRGKTEVEEEEEGDSSRDDGDDSSRDEGDDSSRNGGDDSSRDGDEERTEKTERLVPGGNETEQQEREVLMEHQEPMQEEVEDARGLVIEQAEAVERLVLDGENEEDRKERLVVEDDEEEEEDDDTEDELEEKDEMLAVESRMKPQEQLQAMGLDLLGEDEVSSERKPVMDEEMEEEVRAEDDAHVDEQVDAVRSEVVDEPAEQSVDYQESPPSPGATKPLQHALIPEADNVADSEDSEDEWNYYPNKEKDSTAAVDQPREGKGKEVEEEEEHQQQQQERQTGRDSPVEEDENDLVIQSPELVQDIKCESPKEEEESPELIDTEISAEGKTSVVTAEERETFEERTTKPGDMDFQLNPNAAEFIPISPQLPTGARRFLTDNDKLVSGSPLKGISPMDDIEVPSQSEFDEEICLRPSTDNEGKENGGHVQRTDYTDFMAERQKMSGLARNLDDSEISSTKAEFGDESASFLTASEFHTTSISAVDESFSSSERDYDIAKDPMAMSFTPGDFEAAFERGVDLNAVHDLSTVDLDEKNGTIGEEEASPEKYNAEITDLFAANRPETESVPAVQKEQPTADLLGMESPEPEETEHTFVEHSDLQETKPSQDILLLQEQQEPRDSETSQPELEQQQQDMPKSEESPLTENYSGEFESEKEVVSPDNEEQLLSPSSADIDETKPIDEASEEAAPLPATDSQDEICVREANTPTFLSSPQDTMERESARMEEELVTSVQDMHISSTLHALDTQPDVKEFMPGQHSYGGQLSECSLFSSGVTRAKSPEEEVEPKRAEEEEEAVEPVQEPSTESVMLEEVKKNLLDFQMDGEVCRKSPIEKSEIEVTPPPTPQETFDKISQDINALTVCPESTTVDEPREQSPEPEEQLTKTDVCQLETQKEELFEKVCEPEATRGTVSGLNLSESMQEFTGLEKQLLPEEPAPVETAHLEHEPETVKEEPVQDTMEHEPVVEPVLQAIAKPVAESVQPVTEEIEEVPEVKTEVKEEEAPEMAIEAKEPEVEKPIEAPAETPAEAAIEAAVEATAETSHEPSILQAPIETVTEAPIETPAVAPSEPSAPEAPVAALSEPLTETPAVAPVEPVSTEAKVPVEAPTPAETPLEASEKKTESSAPSAAIAPVAVAAAAAATVAVAGAAAAAAGAAAVKAKASTTKAAAKPSRPAATKTTPKSTPTSPSKTATTKPTSTTAKRPLASTTSRPKELDTKKSTVSSTTAKTAPAKPASAAAPRAPLAAKAAAKPGLSAASKPKPAAASPKTSAEKKPTANGDVKPLSKPATARPAASKPATTTAAASAKSSLTKPAPSSRTSTGPATSTKPRATSATASATASGKSTTRSSTATSATTTRPKTAPASGSSSATTGTAARTRTSTTGATTAAAKSPMIDKQIKETANKQISARTSTSTLTKTTRTSVSSATSNSTTTVKRASTTRTVTSSPTKKAPPTSKTTTTKSVTGTKATAITGKMKVVQNGIAESMQISNTIIETTKSKMEDDVPKKDLSPVVAAPTDNQFIMGSD